MKLNLPALLLTATILTAASGAQAQILRLNFPDQDKPASTKDSKDRSHSHLTSAFNTGPRQQAHLIPNIGNAHFPITTQNPLVQKFFDQGLNQLYSFMYFEAERSFRQCVMLEPENPMPFWALAMNDGGKAPEFLKLANQRRYRASAREQRFIDALKILHDRTSEDRSNRSAKYKAALEQIVLDYPDDLEAKTILAQELYESADRTNGERTAVDALLRDVIAKNPLHPAANHFRIHLWDGPDARAALDSCERYPKAAPGIGHAQHMPGHIYAQLGLWEQAAYQMDAATRVERKWMAEARQLPHETWNFSHNQHYLIANLGYAGRLEEGERLAQELIDVPRDPQGNNGFDFSVAGEGRFAMLRMWLRGERWDKILADEKAGWPNLPRGKTWRSFARILALIGKASQSRDGEAATYLAEAEKALKEFEDSKPGGDAPKCALMEAKGRLLMAQGLAALECAKSQIPMQSGLFALSPALDCAKPFALSSESPSLIADHSSLFSESKSFIVYRLSFIELADEKFTLALAELKKAFDHEKEKFTYNDPGQYPRPAAEAYIQALLQAKKPAEAEKAAKEALKHDPNNGFVLAQLAESLQAQNKTEEAKKAAEEFKEVFKHAAPDLAPIARLRALGLLGSPNSSWTPRPYQPPRALERLGPIAWQPFDAPDFTLPDMDGKKVRLSDYRGKNLLLVFILSGVCDHCIQQLETIAAEAPEWKRLGTEVVVISPASVESLRKSFNTSILQRFNTAAGRSTPNALTPNASFSFTFLADPEHKAAKLYKAYDEFENLELHGTNLITPVGKLWWFRSGSTPFTDMKFLRGEIERVSSLKRP